MRVVGKIVQIGTLDLNWFADTKYQGDGYLQPDENNNWGPQKSTNICFRIFIFYIYKVQYLILPEVPSYPF